MCKSCTLAAHSLPRRTDADCNFASSWSRSEKEKSFCEDGLLLSGIQFITGEHGEAELAGHLARLRAFRPTIETPALAVPVQVSPADMESASRRTHAAAPATCLGRFGVSVCGFQPQTPSCCGTPRPATRPCGRSGVAFRPLGDACGSAPGSRYCRRPPRRRRS